VSLTTYLSYVAFAAVVIIAPGPDFALTVASTLRDGRPGGLRTSLGIATSNTVQGTAAALGLGALIVRSELAFNIIRWAGAAYLTYLGVRTIRAAVRGRYETSDDDGRPVAARRWLAFQQGFLSNITNPKVLALYLSVLPQFLDPGRTSTGDALLLAYTVVVLGGVWLLVLMALVHRVREWLQRRKVRRSLDAVTGTALIGFGIALATES
jgi:threonine/homoserine/homoserine lactone efflux protein